MRTAAIIPAPGGGPELSRVLAALPHDHLREIVVVGAPGAEFADAARRYGATAVEEGRPGYGRACLTGMVHLAPEPPDVVVFLRGDGTDDAEELPAVLSPLLSPRVDFVMGSRSRGNPDSGAYPGLVRFGHWIATRLILLFYGYRFTDLGPFRAIRWQALSQLNLSDPDYGWLAEMQVNAARARITSVEVPVSSRRPTGESGRDSTLPGSFLAGLKVLLTVLRPRSADPPRIRKTEAEPQDG
ncbi:MAG: glycosyltransferase family 2 protein [Acidobacteria bacterium]|nr:glycosyltransferase family 2 protein [Acidobacteriota bacterium]MYA46946.1 glycosyltransferase family 2 protein [Acidobacteriota bacterium]MYH22475.1 glycosyltransferase family 2 protein [Acidobacteriota bacterium]MYI37852.1 glycosyltransferase family 2 protein [Acidobacteriota bacterium]MYK80409.1 glycosyltransferase family 2 protein [Acidobacteriota bacterium]